MSVEVEIHIIAVVYAPGIRYGVPHVLRRDLNRFCKSTGIHRYIRKIQSPEFIMSKEHSIIVNVPVCDLCGIRQLDPFYLDLHYSSLPYT